MTDSQQKYAYSLLRAAMEVLHECRDSTYVMDVFQATATWDGTEQGSYQLMEEIEELIEEIDDDMMSNPALHGASLKFDEVKIHPNPKVRYNMDDLKASKETESNTIRFLTNENNEIITLCDNGDIFVKGKKIENDKELVGGMREFLKINK